MPRYQELESRAHSEEASDVDAGRSYEPDVEKGVAPASQVKRY